MKRTVMAFSIALMMSMGAWAAAADTPDQGPSPHDVQDDDQFVLWIEIPIEGAATEGKGPDSHGASCSGTAPLVNSCVDVLGTTHAGALQIGMSLMPGFTGSVTNAGWSSTGSYSWTCTLVAFPLSYNCPPPSMSGQFLVGQSIILEGSSTSSSVGTWTVTLENV